MKALRRRITRGLTSGLVAVLVPLLQMLPPGLLRPLARAGAWLTWLVPGERRILLANLAFALPELAEAERRRLGRESLRRFLEATLRFWWFARRPALVHDAVRFSPGSAEVYEAARARGRGVIILTPHMGSFDIGHLAMNAWHGPTFTVMREHSVPAVDRALGDGRASTGAQVVRERGAARELIKTLRAGGTACLLIDQNTRPRHGGMFSEYFGLPATMSRAPIALARKTGASMIMAWCVQDRPDQWTTTFEPLVDEPGTIGSDEELAALVNARTEALVRRFPEEYLWLYKRWRYIPPDWDGDRSRYPWYAKTYRDPRDLGSGE